MKPVKDLAIAVACVVHGDKMLLLQRKDKIHS